MKRQTFGLGAAALVSLSAASTAVIGAENEATTPGSVHARLLRYPDVSKTQIACVYAGDIWVAPKAGGTAARLS